MKIGYLDAMIIAARTARAARRQRLARLRMKSNAIGKLALGKISADTLIDDRCIYFLP